MFIILLLILLRPFLAFAVRSRDQFYIERRDIWMSKGSKAPSGKKQVDQNGSFIRKGSSGQDGFSQGWNEGFSRKPDKDPSEDFLRSSSPAPPLSSDP